MLRRRSEKGLKVFKRLGKEIGIIVLKLKIIEMPRRRDMETRNEEGKPTYRELEYDIIVLVLRLLGEDPDTFSPETREVMDRWSEKAQDVLRRALVDGVDTR